MPRITAKELYAWSNYLGNLVGDSFPVLQETACMTQEYRRFYGYLEIIKISLEDKEDKQEISEIQKIVQILGQSEWQKDTITDMALRLGTKTQMKSTLKGDVVEVEVRPEWKKHLETDTE